MEKYINLIISVGYEMPNRRSSTIIPDFHDFPLANYKLKPRIDNRKSCAYTKHPYVLISPAITTIHPATIVIDTHLSVFVVTIKSLFNIVIECS